MKIIDNKKDYYDYLSGVYGIDDKVVFDRRGSRILTEFISRDDSPFFSKKIMDREHNHYERYDEPLSYNPLVDEYYSYSTSRIVIEAGRNHYYIEVVRYRKKKNDPITIKFNGMTEDEYWEKMREDAYIQYKWYRERISTQETEAKNKLAKSPLAIIFYAQTNGTWGSKPTIFENPILKDIPGIAGIVSAEWIWQSLYEYISSLNDKPIVDTRNDIQHLESAGFDKKTSFRNIK